MNKRGLGISTIFEKGVFSSQPRVKVSDFRWGKRISWDNLDEHASHIFGKEVIAVPSVRVAALWILEFLNLSRHKEEIFVPRFLGRCILNTLNRRAMPVLSCSSHTKTALVVHQLGFGQRLPEIDSFFEKSGISYFEDSAGGVDFVESCGTHSLGRLIALSKFLPIIKGGIFLSNRTDLSDFIRHKRTGPNVWSWVIFGGMLYSRARKRTPIHVGWVDSVYELYPLSSSDNGALRANFWHGLGQVGSYESIIRQRLDLITRKLSNRVYIPTYNRLASVVPFLGEGVEGKGSDILRKHEIDNGLYHFDENFNFLDPEFRKVFLIPIHPTIPDPVLNSLIAQLARV